MSNIKAIATIVRLPNLIFIFLTQLLVYQFIILGQVESPTLSWLHWFMLALSTIFIATAGYIINDYFDIGIDAVNKPTKVTIERIFKRRTIILWHIVLNLLALIIAGYIAYHFAQVRLLGFQLISILLLLVYSTTFKRKLLIGNLSIALLTSLTLITTAMYEPQFNEWNFSNSNTALLWVYIIFAFIITLIREIVKDVEDIKGDTVQNCKTIPLVWGIEVAKNIVYALHILMFLFLFIITIYFFEQHKILTVYLILFVFMPLLWNLKNIYNAQNSADFHKISSLIKWITLLGILSMVLV